MKTNESFVLNRHLPPPPFVVGPDWTVLDRNETISPSWFLLCVPIGSTNYFYFYYENVSFFLKHAVIFCYSITNLSILYLIWFSFCFTIVYTCPSVGFIWAAFEDHVCDPLLFLMFFVPFYLLGQNNMRDFF